MNYINIYVLIFQQHQRLLYFPHNFPYFWSCWISCTCLSFSLKHMLVQQLWFAVLLIRGGLTAWTRSSQCQCPTTVRRSLRAVTSTIRTATGCSIRRVRNQDLDSLPKHTDDLCLTSFVFSSSSGQTEDGKKEIIFLSNRNPAMLERICAFLWSHRNSTHTRTYMHKYPKHIGVLETQTYKCLSIIFNPL